MQHLLIADIEKKEKQVQAGEFSKYLLDVYICRNGEVVSLLGRCNNATDCFDHSDEENCMDTTGRCALIDQTFYNGDEEIYKYNFYNHALRLS